jgi:hypothetical protein
MGVEGGSELSWLHNSLSEQVMVLEEFKKTNTVFLDDLFDLDHKGLHGLVTIKVGESGTVGTLGTGVWSINNVGQWLSAILQEAGIFNFVVLISVDKGNEFNFMFTERQTVGSEDLAEDLWANLKVVVQVKILEE